MPNVIEQIIEIDRSARGNVAAAHQKAHDIYEATRVEVEALARDYESQMNGRVTAIRVASRKNAEAEVSKLTVKRDESRAEVSQIFRDHRVKWEDEIFARITSV
ncbi:MAG: hypothetical protein LBN40_05045 [Oscillospiraceae bacterium]|jgi:vacuolar-type H+-ATPase subunit H|nr:hypothetical protein [Oscillospiraceae bacterium]